MEKEILYLLALYNCPKIGEKFIKKLIHKFGSAKNAWFADPKDLLTIPNLGKSNIQFIGDENYFSQAEKQLQECTNNNINIVHLWENNYPFLLKQCSDAPTLLFYKGNINFNLPSISIVGTRKMTSYGKLFTENLVECLSSKKINIISGLALGIDGCAHKKAVEFNIPTIGVLAHGLNQLYPPQHESLAMNMLKNGGLISEYPVHTKPERTHFIQRNRIIAGLSSITIIIESAYGGGAISTAKFANSYNREVFALPGRITDISSQGCNQLIRNLEAQIITQPKDILSFLGDSINKIKQPELFPNLLEDEEIIYKYLKTNGNTSIDTLAVELNLSTFQLMPILLNLELKNIIKSNPGKYFEIE
ncbi:DNA-protecting protein DprA [Apibacter muscae]|uniref:DNA-protecting protein DprA n=1 Tax=Apibacter muscae TaxID=2509004 RepID=A0A563DAF7_9FLAO|nr:DNA-processing protein DprA [Apibacter muscae]TWP27298.1 DNA-protecting protein DprA [Apibacter muscae]